VENLILVGFLGSLGAGLATGVGALPVLLVRRPSKRYLDLMLGFAAGVMLAASVFSLLIPAIDDGGVWVAIGGLLLGALVLHLIDRFVPHEHFIRGHEGPSSRLRKIWLFVLAITIHNFPEGLAVGVGFGSGAIGPAIALAMGIGLQNMPEGLAVALPLAGEGYSRSRALLYATLTGLVEPLGGLLGVSLVMIARPILPWGLAFAAGAMLFVISDEIIPESHRNGHERLATFGVMIGFAVMMLLDVLLG
jgi:ZIP family zinc transporter